MLRSLGDIPKSHHNLDPTFTAYHVNSEDGVNSGMASSGQCTRSPES